MRRSGSCITIVSISSTGKLTWKPNVIFNEPGNFRQPMLLRVASVKEFTDKKNLCATVTSPRRTLTVSESGCTVSTPKAFCYNYADLLGFSVIAFAVIVVVAVVVVICLFACFVLLLLSFVVVCLGGGVQNNLT